MAEFKLGRLKFVWKGEWIGSSGGSITVTNDGSSNYVILGGNDPTVDLTRGATYNFSINAPGHPFWIKTANSTGTGDAQVDGVSGNGTDSGIIQFTVPEDAPDTLYYNCQYHAMMAGEFNIINTATSYGGGIGHPYVKDDVVNHAGSAYICVTAHSSSNSFAADLAAGKWELMAAKGQDADLTIPTTTYGDLVVYGAEGNERLPVGPDGHALVIVDGFPTWEPLVTAQNVYYVSLDGSDENNGTNLTQAFRTIKYACSQVEGPAVIHVQTGTYTEILPIDVPYNVTVQGDGQRVTKVQPIVISNPGADVAPVTGTSTTIIISDDLTETGTTGSYWAVGSRATVSGITGTCTITDVETDTPGTGQTRITVSFASQTVAATAGTIAVDYSGATVSGDTMWRLGDATMLNRMFFSGMSGFEADIGDPEDPSGATVGGVFVGFNPSSPISTKSPYVLECAAFGINGGVGAIVDGTVHTSGLKSMVFHAFTCVNDGGIGFWVNDDGKAEIVSCFTYYCHIGYVTTAGGKIRSLNGNNSYGTYGAVSKGYLDSETTLNGTLYGAQLEYSEITLEGEFVANETVTGGTSGAVGTIVNVQTSVNKIYYHSTSGTFQAGETITGGTSGATATIATGGVSGQKGFILVVTGLSAEPKPGGSIEFTSGDTGTYVIQSATNWVNSSSKVILVLANEKVVASNPGVGTKIRYAYSQCRLTGHDFLSIGTGTRSTTNYPGLPLQASSQGNEVIETYPGRVFYVSTDQDGNFRVGEYFKIDQATGRATLNASAFDLSGLTSLRLGSIGAQLGEAINEFSADATLSGNSNLAVPTEYAVKNYFPQITSDVTPGEDATYNLGSSSYRWQDIHADRAFLSNEKALFVGPDAETLTNDTAGYTGFTDTTAIFTADNDAFVQLALKNQNSGESASTDLIAYMDIGDNNSGWIDLGITSSKFADIAYGVTGPGDGYLFMSAPEGTTITGGTLSSGASTITVSSTHNFPTAGTLYIDGEQVTYSGKTATTFTGCTRGANSTAAASHANGTTVTIVSNGNLYISTSGNGQQNDIVFTTGGFTTGNEKMRLVGAEHDGLVPGLLVEGIIHAVGDAIYQGADARALTQDVTVSTTLATSINSIDTSIVLTDASSFPSHGIITIGSENIQYISKAGNTLTATGGRAYDGTTAASHTSGVTVVCTTLFGLTGATGVFTGSSNEFVQFAVKNLSSGSSASTDFIAYSSDGDNESGWIDLGVTSANYADPNFTVTGPGTGYLFFSAPIDTAGTGDLLVGTDSNGSHNDIAFFTNGFDAGNERMRIIGQNRVGAPAGVEIYIPTESTSTSTGALRVQGGVGIVGNLNVGGNVAITGTITVGGTGSSVSTQSLSVSDPMIRMGKGNVGDTVDLGFFGETTTASSTVVTVVGISDTTITIASATSFAASGRVLLEDEQITYTSITAAATTTLNGAINNSTTSIALTSAASFPTAGTILIESEQITYTGKSTNTLTGCTRGANGTTAASHNSGVTVTSYAQLAGCTRGASSSTAATHAISTPVRQSIFTGLVRDHNDATFKLFKTLQGAIPTSTVNFATGVGIDYAPFKASTLVLTGTDVSTNYQSGALQVAGGVGIGGAVYANSSLSVAGTLNANGSGGIVTNQTSFPLVNTTATTVNFAGAATTLTVGASTGTATINNATVTLANATTLNVNGTSPTIASTSTGTLTLFNTSLLTVNAFCAATSLNLGATSGTTTVRNDLVVNGNMQVNGLISYQDATNVRVSDKNMELAYVTAVTGITGTISGTSTSTTITGLSSVNGLIPGMVLTRTSGAGVFGGTCTIASIDSLTQISITTTASNTAGSVTFNAGGATDVTADGGGITVKGATDKTWQYTNATTSWNSSEHINLASGKAYYINGTSVLSGTALGSGVTSSSLTSVGTLTSLAVGGTTTLQQITEVMNRKTGATGTVAHDYSTGDVFYHSSISANFTANFTNIPTTSDRVITLTLILSQGATPYIPSAFQRDGNAISINWACGTTPTGRASKTDIVTFLLVNANGTFTVYGQLSSFG
jgi:hypothetical protein